MLTDYKFQVIQDTPTSTNVSVVFYEGALVPTASDTGKLVDRYVRASVLRSAAFSFPPGTSMKDITNAMNAELIKDPTRTPADAQRFSTI